MKRQKPKRQILGFSDKVISYVIDYSQRFTPQTSPQRLKIVADIIDLQVKFPIIIGVNNERSNSGLRFHILMIYYERLMRYSLNIIKLKELSRVHGNFHPKPRNTRSLCISIVPVLCSLRSNPMKYTNKRAAPLSNIFSIRASIVSSNFSSFLKLKKRNNQRRNNNKNV